MSLFSKLLIAGDIPESTQQFSVLSPLTGRILPLEHAPSPILQHRLMGEGVCIVPTGNQILAPFSGYIEALPVTGHLLRLRAKNGLRLYFQFARGREQTMGEGFRPCCKAGQEIQQGQPLIELDLLKLKRLICPLVCSLTILNSEKLKAVHPNYGTRKALEEPVFTIYL